MGDSLLLIVFAIVALVPDIVHPVLILHGVQGSGKTTLMKLLKTLIDPSRVAVMSMPDGLREFVQICSHHLVLFLDNVSHLPAWLSDALCRASTGEGFSKRELYTDDDDVIYSYRRVAGVNGINQAATKPDLLDRSLILELERVSAFDSEAALWARFDEARPRIFGAMLTVLSKAMGIVDQIQVPGDIRLVDFARWGSAIAEVLGYGTEAFLAAFRATRERQVQEALDASPVAQAVLALMEERDGWEGGPTELLRELTVVAERMKIDTRSKSWPKAANWLWRRINEVRPNLRQMGVEAGRRRVDNRAIVLSRIEDNADGAVNAVGDEAADAIRELEQWMEEASECLASVSTVSIDSISAGSQQGGWEAEVQ